MQWGKIIPILFLASPTDFSGAVSQKVFLKIHFWLAWRKELFTQPAHRPCHFSHSNCKTYLVTAIISRRHHQPQQQSCIQQLLHLLQINNYNLTKSFTNVWLWESVYFAHFINTPFWFFYVVYKIKHKITAIGLFSSVSFAFLR